ncbi:MAG TPA: single-stranded-DNA-specific exonuclease RecJ [Anaerolineales bacterium]|nr:single-stranded-DNA-specific exonuclease RecJ [Anaerolineales bacterium]
MNEESRKRWEVAGAITPEVDAALKRYPRVLRQLLYNRCVKDEAASLQFLSAAPPEGADPYRLAGMSAAVDRIARAIDNGERIAVYGDYDADGVCATALMTTALSALGATVEPYIPNRFDEGYGLNNDALDELKNRRVSLVVTVDCGIRSLQEAGHAAAIGLDLIVTDHHDPGPDLPEALAVINPKLGGNEYPFNELAGVGTAYKLAIALAGRIPAPGFDPESLLDLVAIGTVADLVPLVSENRHLVREGLETLRTPQRQGLHALMHIAGVEPRTVTAGTIGFVLGPRLNAAGRLDSALAAYELLTTPEVMRAGELAQQLDRQNRERQRITREMQETAEQIAVPNGEVPLLLFAAHPDFNPGVVGLAASRLTELYYRPAIVGHFGEEYTRASCRSIPEFNITLDALDRCADLLERHGGHAAAAGFTVRNDRLDELEGRLTAIAGEKLAGMDLRPSIEIDMELKASELTMDLLNQIDLLQPTGNGNPEPIFITRRLQVADSRTVGNDGSHLKLRLVGDGKTIDAIAFRLGHLHGDLAGPLDVVFRFERNEYMGRTTPQMNVLDIRVH